MQILIKRIYEAQSAQDGTRVLVDRLWPRGLKKENAAMDDWIKDIAPSNELRKWFNHEEKKWPEFKARYFKELDEKEETLKRVKKLIVSGTVTFLYSSKEGKLNNAVALKEYLEKRMRE